ncbi:unnamed protein product [Brachionus calyciflorus]|uniref:Uncharacterized protein n=1 Tax=Brachionus calyciflorus TaxID=104777 RepID=A0A813XQH1_9BILA|nr:unnamed protein product [Brachionus calyciflorus]
MKIDSFKPKLSTRIKNAATEVILSSTSHGLPNIFRSNELSIKIMWTFFTLISAGLCSALIYESFANYFNYEVTTKTRVKHEFKSIFPTVTICNLNYFTSDYSVNFIKSMEKFKPVYNPLESLFENAAKSTKDKFNQGNNSKIFGDSKEKLIVSCIYQKAKCNMSYFTFYNHPHYGNCYTLNSGYDEYGNEIPLWTTLAPKRILGLKLILNTSVPDEIRFVSPNYGAMIIIHNVTDDPFQIEGITVGPRTETNIALNRNIYSSMPKPYSECDANTNDPLAYDSELYKLVHNNTKGYSQVLCMGICAQRLYVKQCGCYIANFPSFFNVRACLPLEDGICINQILRTISSTNYVSDECYKQCPLECDGMNFEKTISTNQYSSEHWIKHLEIYNQSDAKYFNKSINSEDLTAVNIYYQTLSYTNIEEAPTTGLVDLLSNIGGIAGLFLGVSFLSFIEIFELLMQIVLILKNNDKVSG